MQRTRLAIALIVLLLATGPSPAGAAVPGPVSRVGLSASRGQLAEGAYAGPVSAFAARITFVSAAAVTPTITAGVNGVYVRDVSTNAVSCASVSTAGGPGNDRADQPSISSDGAVVAFSSWASDLVEKDGNGVEDVFVRHLAEGRTERVSVGPDGGEADGDSYAPVLSSDGRWVAFVSRASAVVPGASGTRAQIYLRDLTAKQTIRASRTPAGGEIAGDAGWPAISGDGRYVAYETTAGGVVPGFPGGPSVVYRFDRVTGSTVAVSVGASGGQPDGDSRAASISADGRYVAFESTASSIIAGDTNGAGDVFLRDMTGGTTVRVSVSSGGVQVPTASRAPAVSPNGRYVAFTSAADGLVAGDGNAADDVFLRDRDAGTTTRVNVSVTGGEANDPSRAGSFSPDGRFLTFGSDASNLVADDTNSSPDAFLREVIPRAVERLAGPDRYATAVAASSRAFAGPVPAVVVATGRNFPDALGGAALAGVYGGPVLLTPPEALPAAVAAEISRLKPAAAYVLGSERAVSAEVFSQLERLVGAGKVTRIGGADRYATARAVADRVAAAQGFDGTVYVATGQNYPDALAASPLAAARRRPVVLVAAGASAAPALPAGTKRAIVLGSAAAVPAGVSDGLSQQLGSAHVVRIGGADRYETAALIAAAAAADGLAFDGVALATGTDFPDALSGGPVCARLGAVMMLTRPEVLPQATRTSLSARSGAISLVRVLGGPPAVSETVVAAIRVAVGE